MEKKLKRLELMSIISLVLSVALVVTVAVVGVEVKGLSERLKVTENYLGLDYGDDLVPNSTTPPGDFVTDSGEKAEIISKVYTDVSGLLTKPTYIELQMSSTDGYDLLLMNGEDESIYQDIDGHTMIYMDNGTSVFYEDSVYYGEDYNIIQQMSTVLRAIADGDVPADVLITGNGYSEDMGGTVLEYAFDIDGWDNIEKSLQGLSASYASGLTTSIKSSLADKSLSEVVYDIESPHLRYTVGYLDGELLGAACFYYFGEESEGNWSDCIQDWLIAGIYDMGDWEIPQTIYDFDWTTLATADPEVLADMLAEMYAVIETTFEEDENFDKVENADNVESDEDTASEESNSSETSENTEDTDTEDVNTDETADTNTAEGNN